MSNIKRFVHLATNKFYDYVDSHTLDGIPVTMIYSKGVWHTVGTKDFDELVQYGIIELIEKESV
jgi:hypothetical protein